MVADLLVSFLMTLPFNNSFFTADPPVGYDQLVGKALVWRGKMVKLPYLGSVTTYASKFVQ